MSKIFEVRSVSHDNDKVYDWGARHSYAEAEQLLEERFGGSNKEWAEKRHKRWWIEEIDTSDCFKIPSLPMPRDIYSVQEHTVERGEKRWKHLKVDVLNDVNEVITQYNRNYGYLFQTFESFRQGDKMFALISTDYTATSVMDLSTGEVIASEKPDSNGFCPVGFYVPDWWDIHKGAFCQGPQDGRMIMNVRKAILGLCGAVYGEMIHRGRFNILTYLIFKMVKLFGMKDLGMFVWQRILMFTQKSLLNVTSMMRTVEWN